MRVRKRPLRAKAHYSDRVPVRIHYEVPDDLHRRAKAAAALNGVSLKNFVIEALEQATRTAEKRRPKRR